MSINRMKNANLRVGQSLVISQEVSRQTGTTSSRKSDNSTLATVRVPKKTTEKKSPAKPNSKPTTSGGEVYLVKKGDTLSSIAKRYRTTVNSLKKLNGGRTALKPGQKVVVR
jgi:LysM repeat protein